AAALLPCDGRQPRDDARQVEPADLARLPVARTRPVAVRGDRGRARAGGARRVGGGWRLAAAGPSAGAPSLDRAAQSLRRPDERRAGRAPPPPPSRRRDGAAAAPPLDRGDRGGAPQYGLDLVVPRGVSCKVLR